MIIKCGQVEGGRARSESLAGTPLVWSGGANTKAVLAAFAQELVEICDAGSEDDVGEPDEEFVENVTWGKLGKEMILMRVNTGSAKRWVVREMPLACVDA